MVLHAWYSSHGLVDLVSNDVARHDRRSMNFKHGVASKIKKVSRKYEKIETLRCYPKMKTTSQNEYDLQKWGWPHNMMISSEIEGHLKKWRQHQKERQPHKI